MPSKDNPFLKHLPNVDNVYRLNPYRLPIVGRPEALLVDDVTPTPSVTPTITPTQTPTVTPTVTPTPTTTPTNTVTPTRTPTQTPTQTPTVTPTNTVTPTQTPTVTPTRTPTQTPSVTPSPSIGFFTPESIPTMLLVAEAWRESYANDDVVANFQDWTTNQNDLVEVAGASYRPLFKTAGGPNSKAYIQSQDNSKELVATFTLAQTYHVFIVARTDHSTAATLIDADSAQNRGRINGNGDGDVHVYPGGIGPIRRVAETWSIVEVIFSTTGVFRAYGEEVTGDMSGEPDAGGIRLFNTALGEGGVWDVAAIFVNNGELGGSDLTDFLTYISDTYGLPGSVPSAQGDPSLISNDGSGVLLNLPSLAGGALSRKIYRGATLLIASHTTGTYLDDSAAANTNYNYTIKGHNNAGDGAANATPLNVTTEGVPDAPAAPFNISNDIIISVATFDVPALPDNAITGQQFTLWFNRDGAGWDDSGQPFTPGATGATWDWTSTGALPVASFQIRFLAMTNVYGTGPEGTAGDIPLV